MDLDTIVGAVNATSDLIADANQNELIDFTATGSAVNHVGITNAATGNGPTIEAKGDDTNIDLNVSGKGTGKLATTSPKITTGINDSNNNELIKVTATGSAVNEITVANAATGNGPTLSATGDDTNIDLNIAGKGSGTAKFTSNIIIPDAGNVGSVSDPDAIAIASDGGLTFNGGIDDAGTISAGTFNGTIGTSATNNLQDYVAVTLPSNQSLSHATITAINLTSETDPNGWFDISTFKFQPDVAGKYFISLTATGSSETTSGYLEAMKIAVKKNDNSANYTGAVLTARVNEQSARGYVEAVCAAGIVDMNGSSDYLYNVVYGQLYFGSGTLDLYQDSVHFSAIRIGA